MPELSDLDDEAIACIDGSRLAKVGRLPKAARETTAVILPGSLSALDDFRRGVNGVHGHALQRLREGPQPGRALAAAREGHPARDPLVGKRLRRAAADQRARREQAAAAWRGGASPKALKEQLRHNHLFVERQKGKRQKRRFTEGRKSHTSYAKISGAAKHPLD